MKLQKLIHILISIACIGLSPAMHAVNPPPDGCYPGFTTAEGCDALNSLTSGIGNTGLGWRSLFSNATGSFNTGIGAGALVLNTSDSNTAVGAAALLLNITGTNNTAHGVATLVFNNADQNTAMGAFALNNNTTGNFNTANGAFALNFNTAGEENTATGVNAIISNTIGNGNTAMGYQALSSNTTGNFNTAIGHGALISNSTGGGNTTVGNNSLTNNDEGAGNAAVGDQALHDNTTGNLNTAIGFAALFNSMTGDSNIGVGFDAGINVMTASNTICIGAAGEDVSNSCYIDNIFGATSAGGIGVIVNAAGKLGTMVSSQRFKEGITAMGQASETLFALKPVTFRYKKEFDPTATAQFGLVAEEVEKVNPALIVRDKDEKPYSVRYDQVNAMLLNEFLKEHKKVQALEASLVQQQKNFEHQQKQIDALTAGLQKANAELKLSKRAPQLAVNHLD